MYYIYVTSGPSLLIDRVYRLYDVSSAKGGQKGATYIYSLIASAKGGWVISPLPFPFPESALIKSKPIIMTVDRMYTFWLESYIHLQLCQDYGGPQGHCQFYIGHSNVLCLTIDRLSCHDSIKVRHRTFEHPMSNRRLTLPHDSIVHRTL